MKYLLLFLLVFGVFPLSAGETADDGWKAALKFFSEAESKIRSGKNSEAAVLLNTCAGKLKDLQYNFPSWNPGLVRNRLSATKKRTGDVERLIRSKINSLSREELITTLKETLISKAKFSKALLIIYDENNKTKRTLELKTKDLDEARRAASGKLINQSRLDKISFENLKLKKKLQEKDAQLTHLKKSLKNANVENGTDALTKNLEEQYAAIQAREKALILEKTKFFKNKKVLIEDYKALSIKYKELTDEGKIYSTNITVKETEIQTLKTALIKKQEMSAKLAAGSKTLEAKLILFEKRLKDHQKTEKNYLTALEELKLNNVNSKALVKISKEKAVLVKENNRLKQIEVDLSAKNKAFSAEVEKNKNLLKAYINNPVRDAYAKSLKKVSALQKKLVESGKKSQYKDSKVISLKSEIASMVEQMKLQKIIISDLKKRPAKPLAVVKKDDALTKAYAKNEKDLTEQLKFANGKIRTLEIQNRTLKNENIVGDEDMIRKYVQVRNELKRYKAKIREFNNNKGTSKGEILESVISEEEKKELEQSQTIRDYLYNASKAVKNNDIQAAIGLYSKVLKLERNNFDALLRIGLLHYQKKHFHDAKVHLHKAFYLNPDNPQLLLALGIAELELSNLDLAVSSLSRLVGINPKNATARLQLGVSLHGMGWPIAALGQLKKACELDAKNSEAAFNLAMVYLSLPEPKIKEAQENYERAIKLGVVRDPELDKFFKQQN
jgi:Flp pilus assembly protein TadD